MNNPFDYIPSAECEEAFRQLTDRLQALKGSTRPEDIKFCQELDEGKMLGVLIANDTEGKRHTLFAFSGQIGSAGFHFPGFVGPVFDYLQPEGHFRTKEREISAQNMEIAALEREYTATYANDYKRKKEILEKELTAFREKCRQSKSQRDAKRASGELSGSEMEEMVRRSQFEKAELRRIKKRIEAELTPYATRMMEAEARLTKMKERRRNDSETLQQWLFDNFKVMNGKGNRKSLSDIFAQTSMKVPPSGAGECCAPKLLQAAYSKDWQPIAMAEYWYGKPKGGEVRRHGNHYPACRGKCIPILIWMLEGLEVIPPVGEEYAKSLAKQPEILYENEWFCVVDKPSGMLSVAGKGAEMSVQEWLEGKYGKERCVKVVHRLDQDTSGLLIAAFGPLPFKLLQTCFATRRIKKTYVALLEGDYVAMGLPRKGKIELPLSPDYLDRPRQRIDFQDGKEALTEYEFTGVEEGKSRVVFHPLTGRTHQLRVHSAAMEGLGMPIAGDPLYGQRKDSSFSRLHLHAHRIEFVFPIDKRPYCFQSPLPF